MNKKHEGIPREIPGITFETFASRILSLLEHKDKKNSKLEKLVENRFQICKGGKTMKADSKSFFAQLSDEVFYFEDSFISIPIEPLLKNIGKKIRINKIEQPILDGKPELLKL